MKKQYYKVVRDVGEGNTFRSARRKGFSSVNYCIGHWTEAPEGTRLFVFDSFAEARNFCIEGECVFECDVIGGIAGYGSLKSNRIHEFWKIVNARLKNKQKIDFDKIEKEDRILLSGWRAILVKKVKLTKLVYEKLLN